jgi:hypothetical protein
MKTKICSKCGQFKTEDQFSVRLDMRDGRRSECIQCIRDANRWRYLQDAESRKAKQREWNAKNKDKKRISARRWYENNKEKVDESRLKWESTPNGKEWRRKYEVEWREKNREKRNEAARKRYAANPEKFRSANHKWKLKDIEKARSLSRISSLKRRQTIEGTINDRISAGIRQSLNGAKGRRKWETLVGYTIQDLKKHLERQFKSGMTWGHVVNGKIHIDHIIPKSAFKFTSADQLSFKRCWALKNLQPLWANENLQKHNKIEMPFQPTFAF